MAVQEQTEQLVSRPENFVHYAAVREDLRLTKVSRYPIYGANGVKQGESTGEALQFRNGSLFIPPDRLKLADGQEAGPEKIQEIITWLERHPLLNDTLEGFFRVERSAPPVSQEELDTIVDAALEADEARLLEIRRQEAEGWGRGQIIEAVDKGLEKLRNLRAAWEAEQAKQQKTQAKKAE